MRLARAPTRLCACARPRLPRRAVAVSVARRCQSGLAQPEDVVVPTKSGPLPLRARRPAAILLLPPLPLSEAAGGVPGAADPLDRVGAVLSSVAGVPVVRANYRGGPAHLFPGPLFDAVAAFDWAAQNAGALAGRARGGAAGPARIGAYASGFGASLAAAVGLTEGWAAGAGRPAVPALALQDPVVDWTAGAEAGPVPDYERLRKEGGADGWAGEQAAPSERLRAGLFRTFRNTLDPFASPMHFFRLPLVNEVVTKEDEGDDEAELPDYELTFAAGLGRMPSFTPRVVKASRKSFKAFPPSTSDLRIPDMYIRATARGAPVRAQVDEFVGIVRRQIRLQELPGRVDRHMEETGDRVVDEDAIAEELVRNRIYYIAANLQTKPKRKTKTSKRKALIQDTSAVDDAVVTSNEPDIDPELAHLVAIARWFSSRLTGP